MPLLVALWTAVVAFLMISNVATLSWKSVRPRSSLRLAMIGLVGIAFAALLTEPWWTLAAICLAYLALVPLGVMNYAKVKRQRVAAPVVADPSMRPLDVTDVR